MPETAIVNQIKKGDKAALKQVYVTHKAAFVSFLISRYRATPEAALEVYQFTILRLYDNIVQGKLQTLTSSLKSYLFAIGKNIWKEQVRARQKANVTTDSLLVAFVANEGNQEWTEQQLQEKESYYKKMAAGLLKMGNPCKALLEFFYYEKWSMQQIADALGFKNTNVAKTKKVKCLKRLKAIVQSDKVVLQNG